MIRFSLLAATALIAAAPLAAAPTTKPAEFVKTAGASDLYEKTSSRMILKSTKNADVRRFATMMVADHGKTTAQVTAAAKKDGLKPTPPKLTPDQEAKIAQLKSAPADQRDKAYVDQQVMSHEEALAVHQTYARSGESAALRQAASGAVPVVQNHLTEIKGIQGKLGGM